MTTKTIGKALRIPASAVSLIFDEIARQIEMQEDGVMVNIPNFGAFRRDFTQVRPARPGMLKGELIGGCSHLSFQPHAKLLRRLDLGAMARAEGRSRIPSGEDRLLMCMGPQGIGFSMAALVLDVDVRVVQKLIKRGVLPDRRDPRTNKLSFLLDDMRLAMAYLRRIAKAKKGIK